MSLQPTVLAHGAMRGSRVPTGTLQHRSESAVLDAVLGVEWLA